jgi:hypothetical protein
MKLCIATHHATNYQSLTDLTFPNKQAYAEKYGYDVKDDIIQTWHNAIGFDKIQFCSDILSNYEWVWWTPTDGLLTNFNIDIATIADNNYHFIIASDCNGLNADSFLIRNSQEGHDYFKFIMSVKHIYKNHVWLEQSAMINTYDQWKNIIKIVPQRVLNSYDYSLYPQHQPIDKLGTNGHWQSGDLVIHWPGTSLSKRLELAKYYLPLVNL